jgi:hypothetical protein
MTRSQRAIVLSIGFLEDELERMGEMVQDVENGLLANPTDSVAGRKLEAIYALAGETWERAQALRLRLGGGTSAIYYDRSLHAPDTRAWRESLG